MKCSKNHKNVQKLLQDFVDSLPLVRQITKEIDARGGRALAVGGIVRDLYLGVAIKDLDIEVYGLQLEELETILRSHGRVDLVGKSFGVLRVAGLDVDWSLPRSDSAGRKPDVAINPNMPFEKSFLRRDLTVNAMGIDIKTGELIDPFSGLEDLCAGVLRAPDVALFVEDPLRFFRVMQFVGRFAMTPDDALSKVCATIELCDVSIERVEAEFGKLMMRAQRPSLGLRWLRSVGRLKEILPELAATIDVPQQVDWHPEGDVFEHSMQTVDAAAALPYDAYQDQREQVKKIMMYAALCHDLGKATTTTCVDGIIKSHGHEHDSAKFSKRMLKRIMRNNDIIDAVEVLCKYHMVVYQFAKDATKLAAYKRLACKMAPHATLQMLADLSTADKRGRNAESTEPLTTVFEDVTRFLQRAEEAHVVFEVERPVLLGRDLLDVVKPGPELGVLLKKAYDIQLDEGITDVAELKARVTSGK